MKSQYFPKIFLLVFDKIIRIRICNSEKWIRIWEGQLIGYISGGSGTQKIGN
jgi:hypothetical protein